MGVCLLVVFFLANREMDGIWGKTFERNSSTIIHKPFFRNEAGKMSSGRFPNEIVHFTSLYRRRQQNRSKKSW